MGENQVTCLISLFEALNDAFEKCIFFSGLYFHTSSKTLIACRDMQIACRDMQHRFLKWKHCETMPLKYPYHRCNITHFQKSKTWGCESI